jgi:hypothetical protein
LYLAFLNNLSGQWPSDRHATRKIAGPFSLHMAATTVTIIELIGTLREKSDLLRKSDV